MSDFDVLASIVFLVLLLLVILPAVLFLIVKCMAYAFYMGRRKFFNDYPEQKKEIGDGGDTKEA